MPSLTAPISSAETLIAVPYRNENPIEFVVFYGAPEMTEDGESTEFWSAIASEVEANYSQFFAS